jgi:hypothetical protein
MVHPERINNVTSDLLITPQYLVNAPVHMNLHDNLSDKTLKTILNLQQSDRAQTQQQKRALPLSRITHDSSKNCHFNKPKMADDLFPSSNQHNTKLRTNDST